VGDKAYSVVDSSWGKFARLATHRLGKVWAVLSMHSSNCASCHMAVSNHTSDRMASIQSRKDLGEFRLRNSFRHVRLVMWNYCRCLWGFK
jgi:hypothetical protein